MPDQSTKALLRPVDQPLLVRLRRAQAWRRKRLQRLINDPDIDRNDPDRRKAICAGQHYTGVSVRAEALVKGLIKP